MYNILQALSFMHWKGIIHGDLKPENIMFDDQGVLKIIDFGCAYRVKDMYKGTLLYKPPELHYDSKFNQCAIDIWAFGLICFELFGGNLKKICNSVNKGNFKEILD